MWRWLTGRALIADRQTRKRRAYAAIALTCPDLAYSRIRSSRVTSTALSSRAVATRKRSARSVWKSPGRSQLSIAIFASRATNLNPR